MKLLIILASFTFIAPISVLTELNTKCYAVLQRTVTGYGDTKGAAYADASRKIPTGYQQIRVSFFKVGYKWQCYLTCKK